MTKLFALLAYSRDSMMNLPDNWTAHVPTHSHTSMLNGSPAHQNQWNMFSLPTPNQSCAMSQYITSGAYLPPTPDSSHSIAVTAGDSPSSSQYEATHDVKSVASFQTALRDSGATGTTWSPLTPPPI